MRTTSFLGLILMLVLVVLASCQPPPIEPTSPSGAAPSTTTPTIPGVDEYHALLTADASIPSVPPQVLRSTESAALLGAGASLCITERQTFSQVDASPQPISALAIHILESLGYRPLSTPDAQDCDARLNVQLDFQPLSEKYAPTTGGQMMTCYTGAKASGKATLTTPAGAAEQYDLGWTYGPYTGLLAVIDTCPGPEGAPFEDAMTWALLDGMTQILGKRVLVSLLSDPDADLRARAATLMGSRKLAEAEDLPGLVQLLEDQDAGVRQSAVVAIGSMGMSAEAAFSHLVSLLQDPELHVRVAAIDSLQKVGPANPDLVPAMIGALNDPEGIIRQRAVYVLDSLGPEALEAVPALLELFENHPEDSYIIGTALESISGRKLGFELETWKTWWAERNQQP